MLLIPKLGLCKIAQLGRIPARSAGPPRQSSPLWERRQLRDVDRDPPLDAGLASQSKDPARFEGLAGVLHRHSGLRGEERGRTPVPSQLCARRFPNLYQIAHFSRILETRVVF